MARDLSSPRPLVEEKPQLHFIDLERDISCLEAYAEDQLFFLPIQVQSRW